MTRLASTLGLALVAGTSARAWSLAVGDPSGNRFAPGKGSFPRWHGIAVATETPLRWLVALPPGQIGAVDQDGTLWVFAVTPTAITVLGRYGELAGPDSPPIAVGLD